MFWTTTFLFFVLPRWRECRVLDRKHPGAQWIAEVMVASLGRSSVQVVGQYPRAWRALLAAKRAAFWKGVLYSQWVGRVDEDIQWSIRPLDASASTMRSKAILHHPTRGCSIDGTALQLVGLTPIRSGKRIIDTMEHICVLNHVLFIADADSIEGPEEQDAP